MAFVDRLDNMWHDQAEINRLFRPDGPPVDYNEKVALTKEMILHLESELHTLLNALGAWKLHRRQHPFRENRPAILNELTDIHRYLLTLYEIWHVNPCEAVEAFRRKGMVVRQRHAEEYVHSLEGAELAIVDIDNVLADYITGFKSFLRQQGIVFDDGTWVNAANLNIPHSEFEALKHLFCIQGHFGDLPLMPNAREFLAFLRERQYVIILLTARPIVDYPTIYTDTLIWLDHHDLPFDYIWWAEDKGDLVRSRGLPEQARVVVDDNLRHIVQYCGDISIRPDKTVFWLRPQGVAPAEFDIVKQYGARTAGSLREVMQFLDAKTEV